MPAKNENGRKKGNTSPKKKKGGKKSKGEKKQGEKKQDSATSADSPKPAVAKNESTKQDTNKTQVSNKDERASNTCVGGQIRYTNDHLDEVPLSVSQNSADNATNACSFISVVLGNRILTSGNINAEEFKEKIVSYAENSITDSSRQFNPHRDASKYYDVQEAYSILREADVIERDYQLTEGMISPHCVYSEDGKKQFAKAMKKLQSEMQNSRAVAIYTCVPYILLIGCVDNKFFLVDSHPVVPGPDGVQTGVALFSKGHQEQCSFIYEWLTCRLKISGVTDGKLQSFVFLKSTSEETDSAGKETTGNTVSDSPELEASNYKDRLTKLKRTITLTEEKKEALSSRFVIDELTPSTPNDIKKIKYYDKMSGEVRKNFEKAGQYIGNYGKKRDGNYWHKILADYIREKDQDEEERNRAKTVVNNVKAFFLQYNTGYEFELLEAEFPINGFMVEKSDPPRRFFWNGSVDAIGWYDGNYVIVDWKVVDLLEFWEKNPKAYGDYLHQCLVYAKLLEVHLGLPKLPHILIVPISSVTEDIRPSLFYEFPKECKDQIETYEWSTELIV